MDFNCPPQYPASDSPVQDAKSFISEVSNADSVPRQSRLFDRVRFVHDIIYPDISSRFPLLLVFQLDRSLERRELSDSRGRTVARNNSVRSFMHFRSAGSHRSPSRRFTRVSNPLQRKPQRGNGQYRLMMWSSFRPANPIVALVSLSSCYIGRRNNDLFFNMMSILIESRSILIQYKFLNIIILVINY